MSHITPWAILLLVTAMLVSPISALTETLQDDFVISESAIHSANPSLYYTFDGRGFGFDDIQNWAGLRYISVVFPGLRLPSGMGEGRHDITWSFVTDTQPITKNGVVYITISDSDTRYTFFFYDWDVGTRTGHARIYTSLHWPNMHRPYNSPHVWDNYFGISVYGEGSVSEAYSISAVSVSHWENIITISEYDNYSYYVSLTRVINSVSSPSTLNAGDFSSYSAVNQSVYLSRPLISVSVENPWEKIYTYNLDSGGSTPTGPEDASFSLTVTPNTAAVGDPITASLSPAADAPAWDEVCYQHIGLAGREEVGYLHNATGWWTTDYSYPLTYTASTEAAATQFNFSAYWVAGTPETDTVYAWVYNEGALVAELQATLTIQQNAGTSSILNVVVIDYSGGSTPILSGATVICEDAATGASIPQTGSDSTWSRFLVTKGRLYDVTASADGYVTGSRTVRPTSDRETLEIYLSRNATVYVPENDTQIDFRVVDTSNEAVEGALIALTDQSTSQTYTGLTNAYGTRTFVVDAENILKFTVSKTGYAGVSGVVDPSIPGTRTICIAPQTSGTAPDGNTTDPSTADHHAMVNQTLEDAYGLVPGIFGFALMMLFFAVIRRGGR